MELQHLRRSKRRTGGECGMAHADEGSVQRGGGDQGSQPDG